MNKLLVLMFAAGSALLLTGCPAGLGGKDYSREQARTVQEVQMGVVESVREVTIEGTKSPVGTAAGAVVGGVAGSTVGGGRGSVVGATVGAVLGGVGGAAAEEAITRQRGLEITVRLDSGRMIAVTQAADEDFRVGDRVRVLSGGGTTRVTH
ncbi:MAG: glycine zipper 2TM domain-containing protein [Thiobacillus sp.]